MEKEKEVQGGSILKPFFSVTDEEVK